jgi:methylmalonyl-CoA carboxyltransferase 5S subunit
MLGYYGETIGKRDPALIEQAAKQAKKEAIEIRPADLLKPEWGELRSAAIELKGCNGTDEDVLTYAMFPQVAAKFFGTRDQGPKNLGKDPAKAAPAVTPAAAPQEAKANGRGALQGPVTYEVSVNGAKHKVTVAPV